MKMDVISLYVIASYEKEDPKVSHLKLTDGVPQKIIHIKEESCARVRFLAPKKLIRILPGHIFVDTTENIPTSRYVRFTLEHVEKSIVNICFYKFEDDSVNAALESMS